MELIYEEIRAMTRKNTGKESSPSLGLIDSQSIKTTRVGGQQRGVNGGKKIKGRKRQFSITPCPLQRGKYRVSLKKYVLLPLKQ